MTEFAYTICIALTLPPNTEWETHLELFRRSLPIAITIVYAANAAPNEIGIWFLLSAHPFLALPARLREAAATVNLGSTTRAEIFQLGREGKGREGVLLRRERRVVKMTVPYAFLALSPPLPGNSAANPTR